MVLAFILDAVGHHQIGVLRWHDRLQGAWAFVILTLGLSWIRATELNWVLVYTLFERISREGEVILSTGSIDLQISIYTSFNTCPSIPGIAASLPSFPSHFVGEKKRALASTCRNVLKPAQASTCQRRRPPHPHTTSQARQGCIEDDDSGLASTSLFQPPTLVVAQHHSRISLVGDFSIWLGDPRR